MKKISPTHSIASRLLVVALTLVLVAAMSAPVAAGTSKTPFPDKDNNGFPDDGHYVTGVYTSYYYEDADGSFYRDLGDGRVSTSEGVTSVEDLNQETLTKYTYHIQYRADFGNDPYMDQGWIRQTIHGQGYAGNSVTTYFIVSGEDPRYTGNSDRAVWGSWEYIGMTFDGEGNVANPQHPEYYFG